MQDVAQPARARTAWNPGAWAVRVAAWVVLAFLALPLVILVGASFSSVEYVSFPPQGFSLEWYYRFFQDPVFFNSFVLSTQIAAGSTVVAILVGFPAAYALVRKQFPGRTLLLNIFLSPVLVPQIILGVALLQYLAIFGIATSFMGLLLAHTMSVTPYVVRTVTAALVNTHPNVEEAAADLGATGVEILFLIVAPIVKPALIAGGLFAFIMSWINVEISIFLSVTGSYTLPVVLFNFMEYSITTVVVAAASVAIFVSLAIVLIVDRMIGINNISKV